MARYKVDGWLDAWFIPWMVLFVGALWIFGSL
jgi:hypothetical protein